MSFQAEIIAGKMLRKKRADLYDEEFRENTLKDRMNGLMQAAVLAWKKKEKKLSMEAAREFSRNLMFLDDKRKIRTALKHLLADTEKNFMVLRGLILGSSDYDNRTGGLKGFYALIGALEVDSKEELYELARWEGWKIALLDNIRFVLSIAMGVFSIIAILIFIGVIKQEWVHINTLYFILAVILILPFIVDKIEEYVGYE